MRSVERNALILSLALALGGCRRDTPRGTKILDPGEGAENEAPLLPLVPGQVRGGVVVDATPLAGRVRVEGPGRMPADYVMDDLGTSIVWIAGVGEFERPLLEVPATVRLGMVWQSDPGDPFPVSTFEVIERTEHFESRLGVHTRWRVDETPEGGETVRRFYDEGVGWAAEGVAVVPRDDPGIVLGAGPYAEVRSAEAPGAPDLWHVTRAEAVDLGPSESLVMLYGSVPCFQGGRWQECRHTECYRFDGDSLDHEEGERGNSPYTGNTCPWTQTDNSYWDWAGAGDSVAIDGMLHSDSAAIGWVSGTDGSPRMLRWQNNDLGGAIQTLDGSLEPLVGFDLERGSVHTGTRFLFEGGTDGRDWIATAGTGGVGRFGHGVGRVHPWEPLGSFAGTQSGHRLVDGFEVLVTSADGAIDRLVVEDGVALREHLASVELADTEWMGPALRFGTQVLGFVNRHQDARPTTRLVFVSGLDSAPRRSPVPRHGGIEASWTGSDLLLCWPATDETLDPSRWTLGGVPVAGAIATNDHCAVLLREPPEQLSDWPEMAQRELTFNAEGPVPGIGDTTLALGVLPATADLGEPLEFNTRPVALADGRLVTRTHSWDRAGAWAGRPSHNVDSNSLYEGLPDESGLGIWHPQIEFVDGEPRLIAALISPDGGVRVDFGPQTVNTGTPNDIVATMPGGGAVFQKDRISGTFAAVYPDGSVVDIAAPVALGFEPWVAEDDGRLCGPGQVRWDEPAGWLCFDGDGAPTYFVAVDGSIAKDPLHGGVMRTNEGTLLVRGVVDGATWIVRFDPSTGSVTPVVPTGQLNGAKTPYGYWRDPHGDWWAVDRDETGRDHPIRFTPEGVVRYELDQPWVDPPPGNDPQFRGVYVTDSMVLLHRHRDAGYIFRLPRGRLTAR